MSAPDRPGQVATADELKVLAHPLRWRILRLCLDRAWTNQELAARLDVAPATVLRHVRALVNTDFLVAEPVRAGKRGSRERPYRATGRTWQLGLVHDGDGLALQVDLALLAAHRAEIIEAGPESGRDLARGTLQLNAASLDELRTRLAELLGEFNDRTDPDGEPLSYLWSLARRPD